MDSPSPWTLDSQLSKYPNPLPESRLYHILLRAPWSDAGLMDADAKWLASRGWGSGEVKDRDSLHVCTMIRQEENRNRALITRHPLHFAQSSSSEQVSLQQTVL